MTMTPKPKHWDGDYGAWFKDAQVAAAYPHRPPYPTAAIDVLVQLAGAADGAPGRRRAVLDIGCGTGDVARRLAPLMDRIDAVDFSDAMIAQGQRLPGGAHPAIRWTESAVETAPLSPPYALVTAGESLHWMRWDVVLPRLRAALAPGGVLAILNRDWDQPQALRDRLRPIFARFSANKDYRRIASRENVTCRGIVASAQILPRSASPCAALTSLGSAGGAAGSGSTSAPAGSTLPT